jgi:glucose/arabinose dehydrogenase
MKRQVITWSVILIAAFILGLFIDFSTASASTKPTLTITSVEIPKSHVRTSSGDRGAAIAQLADGRSLLGGGKDGFSLFLFDPTTQSETFLGRVDSTRKRLDDSRFAITDIAVLSETANGAAIVASYPTYDRSRQCVAVSLAAYQLNFATPSLQRNKTWFTSKPCVPVSAVQHAAGRIEVIDKTSVYLTIGDLGFTKINQPKVRGDLGSIFKVSQKSVEKISQGHRNQQGIVLREGNLYISEHGPRGGDELNLITKGQDYGWPAVTFGEPYSSGDYVRPKVTGSHEGFTKPLTNWVPSVAPTELIALPQGPLWGTWQSQLVMGTLREESLIFIQLRNRTTVGAIEKVSVGERIRDLDLAPDGKILATTDSGQLLMISPGK